MDINEVYAMAEKENVTVTEFRLDETKSLSMRADSGDCYIGIDEKQFKTNAEKKVALAHELGHCKTGSFYNKYSKFDLVCKHEYRANRQAVLDLVPYDDFIDAIRRGHREKWELAEYFEVTEDFIEEVVKHYTAMGKDFKYK